MAADPKSWADSLWPIGAIFGGAFSFIATRKFWSLFFRVGSNVFNNEDVRDAQERKRDERERRNTFRRIDNRANVELERAWKRQDEMQEDIDAANARAVLWEARCRRSDELAHQMRQSWINERLKYNIINEPPIPRIPLLEEPL